MGSSCEGTSSPYPLTLYIGVKTQISGHFYRVIYVTPVFSQVPSPIPLSRVTRTAHRLKILHRRRTTPTPRNDMIHRVRITPTPDTRPPSSLQNNKTIPLKLGSTIRAPWTVRTIPIGRVMLGALPIPHRSTAHPTRPQRHTHPPAALKRILRLVQVTTDHQYYPNAHSPSEPRTGTYGWPSL